ncbi:MAG TPA: 3-phosphoshikimate 1-carboxyvinyltransferase [Longimicrobium sp.]|jgi:3-phosphoshikimate 1-carboxyvinyltransferase|uniref:3-phosphoshikimate 1-carboxyvinyltransferase n=1 Tax=Longimicrobium sp. TaxID=2029185 RepID=UPI002ED9329B
MKLHVSGDVTVPGDKSMTHRALMFSAVADGESRLRGLLPGADCRSTASVLRALSVDVPVPPADGSEIRVVGRGIGAWTEPREWLDCGNSGTTARLMMGLLASRPFNATLTGDDSLRSRPMRRITAPLERMGARFQELGASGTLPIEVGGGPLRPLHYASPKASAQIKSAVLLAGLGAGVPVSVTEPVLSRDHTERMLRGLGEFVQTSVADGAVHVSLTPSGRALPPLDLSVPGDPSSAAFLVALALLADEGELRIRDVCVNPTRTGFFELVARMGARIARENQREEGGELVADLVVRPARLRGIEVGGQEVPAAIDEIPMLAVLAARAEGETRITGAGELRVKETDRIAAVAGNLRALGVDAEELEDGLIVRGTDRPLSGAVHSYDDHRVAMAFGVLGACPENSVEIDDRAVVDVSFPGFWELLAGVTGQSPD